MIPKPGTPGNTSIGLKTYLLSGTFVLFMTAGFLVWRLPLLPLQGPIARVKIPFELTNAHEITTHLAQQGVLRYPALFRRLLKLGGWDKRIQRGVYDFGIPESWPRLIKKITRGDTVRVKVTIPEGWRASQIAERLQAAGVITDMEGFLRYVEENKLEGFLFPTTYFLTLELKPAEAAEILRTAFRQTWKERYEGRTAALGLNAYQTVTLASIIEREATVRAEAPLIAAVYLNRLKKRWKLEADPTVQYALGFWKNRILYKDLEIDSPYNTYKYRGLPSGPICSPGVEALDAVFAPAQTEAMYFVAVGSGTHAFSQSIREHNSYKAEAKKLRRARKSQKK